MRHVLTVSACSALIILGMAWFIYRKNNTRARIAATHSLVASVYQAISSTASANPVTNANWQTLNPQEYDELMSAPLVRNKIDKPKYCSKTAAVLDLWGNRLKIAVRAEMPQSPEYIVWSNGPDGVSGTIDDVIVPEGAGIENERGK